MMRDGLSAIEALRSRLSVDGFLAVIHPGGHVWEARCSFASPATEPDISVIEAHLEAVIPKALRDLLLCYNGITLYEDMEYGQWGFRICGTEELLSLNSDLRQRFAEQWPPNFLAFARELSDLDVLILDTGRPTAEGEDCRVVDGDSEYEPSEWRTASISFGAWVDHLVVAQGAKYWRWQ